MVSSLSCKVQVVIWKVMMSLYLIALKVEGLSCLVVGGGPVAERKIAKLLECGASVTVVSPSLTPVLQGLAEQNQIHFLSKGFQDEDLHEMQLVIAATNDKTTNEQVAKAAGNRHIPVNVVDTPDLCDFYVPATVSRGEFQIGITTGGKSPLLAKQLRVALEKQFGDEYATFVEYLGRLRAHLKQYVPDRQQRMKIETSFLDSPALTLLRENKIKEVERIFQQCISHFGA